MIVFPRIDPDHVLAQAARETNEHAAEHGVEATLDWLGMGASFGEVSYLGQQRALRAVAATLFDVDLGAMPQEEAERICQGIVTSPTWRQTAALLISCYADGFTIGWRARMLAEARDGNPDS